MRKIHRMSVKWKLFGYFAFFVAVVMLLLWLFQSLLLDDFYEAIKRRELTETADALAEQLAADPEGLDTVVAYHAVHYNICTLVYRIEQNRARAVASAEVISGCIIHNIGDRDRSQLYERAVAAGGSYLEKTQLEGLPEGAESAAGGTIYIRIAYTPDGTQYVIMLNASHAPVSATVKTLRVQLLCLSGILLVFAMLLAWLISLRVTRPIVRISAAARRFGEGDYDTAFHGGGYREIDELADTLNYASAEVSKSDRLQKELIANISHDLRTPLTMIVGYGEVMRDLPGENTPENVQVIIDEATRLSELVNDLLDLSRLETGTRAPLMQPLNLTELVRAVMVRYTKLTERDGYRIHFSADRDVSVSADRTMLLQVVYNLINNAINYTGADRRVTVTQSCAGGHVRISVSDTGAGIAPDQLPLIWERYYKVDRVHRRAMVGTGLGLSIVKQILEAHHAVYGVSSQQGEGSTFWFEMEEISSGGAKPDL